MQGVRNIASIIREIKQYGKSMVNARQTSNFCGINKRRYLFNDLKRDFYLEDYMQKHKLIIEIEFADEVYNDCGGIEWREFLENRQKSVTDWAYDHMDGIRSVTLAYELLK